MNDPIDTPAFPLLTIAGWITAVALVMGVAGAALLPAVTDAPGAAATGVTAACVVWLSGLLCLLGIAPLARLGAYPLAMAQVVCVGVRMLLCIGGGLLAGRVMGLDAGLLMPTLAVFYLPVLMVESWLLVRFMVKLGGCVGGVR